LGFFGLGLGLFWTRASYLGLGLFRLVLFWAFSGLGFFWLGLFLAWAFSGLGFFWLENLTK
jgi:hypothetical protein